MEDRPCQQQLTILHNIANEIIQTNWLITVDEISNIMAISFGSAQQIIIEQV